MIYRNLPFDHEAVNHSVSEYVGTYTECLTG